MPFHLDAGEIHERDVECGELGNGDVKLVHEKREMCVEIREIGGLDEKKADKDSHCIAPKMSSRRYTEICVLTSESQGKEEPACGVEASVGLPRGGESVA